MDKHRKPMEELLTIKSVAVIAFVTHAFLLSEYVI